MKASALLLSLIVTGTAVAGEAKSPAHTIAPFINDMTFVVVRIDVPHGARLHGTASWRPVQEIPLDLRLITVVHLPHDLVESPLPSAGRLGSRVLLVVPPKDGYGAAGSPPKISGTDTLVFVVDILAAY